MPLLSVTGIYTLPSQSHKLSLITYILYIVRAAGINNNSIEECTIERKLVFKCKMFNMNNYLVFNKNSNNKYKNQNTVQQVVGT